MNNSDHFENCISLGWYCGTAGSMSKYGLRGFSGPFDWYYSDFDQVLGCIENGFSDFFLRENLERDNRKPRTFVDKKHGFVCFHDIKTDLDEDYQTIYQKYKRRGERFLDEIRKPTCFIRMVRDEDEIDYIRSNPEYISDVLKRYNPKSTVVFLIPEGMGELSSDFRYYFIDREYKYDAYGLRTMFDCNRELLDFCKTILPQETITANLTHGKESNAVCASEVYRCLSDDEENIDRRILSGLGAAPEEGIYLWGGGYHGKALYRYLTGKGVRINAIIDINAGSKPDDGIKYILPSAVPDHSRIFISIADERANDEVMTEMKGKDCTFLTFRDIMNRLC